MNDVTARPPSGAPPPPAFGWSAARLGMGAGAAAAILIAGAELGLPLWFAAAAVRPYLFKDLRYR